MSDSKSLAFGRGGSSPPIGTTYFYNVPLCQDQYQIFFYPTSCATEIVNLFSSCSLFISSFRMVTIGTVCVMLKLQSRKLLNTRLILAIDAVCTLPREENL